MSRLQREERDQARAVIAEIREFLEQSQCPAGHDRLRRSGCHDRYFCKCGCVRCETLKKFWGRPADDPA